MYYTQEQIDRANQTDFAESGGKPYPGGQTAFVVFPPVRDVLLPGTGRFSKGHKAA